MSQQNRSRERALAALAQKQYGVVAYAQLLDLGFDANAIAHRCRAARLHRLHRGVYALGHRAIAIEGRRLAAVLACGPGAALSHWSAAAHWGLLRPMGAVIDVVVPRTNGSRKGIRVHRATHADLTHHNRIPITTVPRTLLDIAAVARPNVLTRAVNEADRQGRLDRRAIHHLLERNRGRRGTKRLRAVIAAVSPGTHRTRSDLEAAFFGLCAKHRLPRPNPGVKIAGIEVDFLFPGSRLIVELDHYEYHRTPREFDHDRRRDARLKQLGYEVLRVSDAWMNSAPAEVAATVRGLVERCRLTPGHPLYGG